MNITLDKVIPWGRPLNEYIRMFDLSDADLKSNILDCASGPASFNAELTQRGSKVVSCDPIYRFSAEELAQRIEETRPEILTKTTQSRENFVWKDIQSVAHLENVRMSAMQKFLEDFPTGLSHGRYFAAELPTLPFQDRQFDLALCSHFLFTYSNLLTLDFHLDSIRELCRVAREVRVFPLLQSFDKKHSPYVAEVMNALTAEGCSVEVRKVQYEFQKDGNEMIVLSSNSDLLK